MASIVVRGFNGENPIIDPELLPENSAQVARNVKLQTGDLRPLRDAKSIVPIFKDNPQTIYRFGQDVGDETLYWFTFLTDVDIARGPINEDSTERTYYTGDGFPKITNSTLALSGQDYPAAFYRLGVPAPTTALSATVTGTPIDPNSPEFTSVYVVTYVSSFGEEGPPNIASNLVTYQAGQSIELSLIPGAPAGPYNITTKRIYRAATGTVGAVFRFLAEIPVGQTDYIDTIPDEQLGEIIQTEEYEMLPDGARGLCAMANGIFAAFLRQTIYFSPAFLPYAYPPRFQLSVDAEIVGIMPFGQSLFVGTKANPYLISGTDPEFFSQIKYPNKQACTSKRSMVSMLGGVLFASPDGIQLATESSIQNMTERIFTRDQWQEYNPQSISAYEINNQYVAFYEKLNGEKGSLIFDFTGKQAFLTRSEQWYPSAYSDRFVDSLYVAQGTFILKWDEGLPLDYEYRSKLFRQTFPNNFGFAQVESETYPVTFELYGDGVLRHTQIVLDSGVFRLPGGYRAAKAEFAIIGGERVKAVTLAESIAEMKAR